MRILLFVCLLAAAVGLRAQTPVISDGGLVNAASFAGGQIVTPGSLVSIFGTELASGLTQADTIPLGTSLGGVSVSFNDIPAPLLFVSQGQINAQLPWNVLAGSATSGPVNVVVRRGSTASQVKQFQAGPFSPGIFAVEFGVGQAIAINPNGLLAAAAGSVPGLVTEPAPIGGAIVIYATGMGAVDPPAVSGQASLDTLRTNTTIPTVLIGGREAQVLFSGLTPQFVGVNQLNVIVPQGVTPGNAVPLQIRVGGITTTNRVTIAVRAP